MPLQFKHLKRLDERFSSAHRVIVSSCKRDIKLLSQKQHKLC